MLQGHIPRPKSLPEISPKSRRTRREGTTRMRRRSRQKRYGGNPLAPTPEPPPGPLRDCLACAKYLKCFFSSGDRPRPCSEYHPIGTAYTYQEQPICPACHKHTKHTGLSLHCPHCNGPICPHCNAHIKTTHAACVYQETKA